MLEIGIKAPDFSLPDQNGESRSLFEQKTAMVKVCSERNRILFVDEGNLHHIGE